jgi:octaheme c-type cytochrome (tetrathionate reductase family)
MRANLLAAFRAVSFHVAVIASVFLLFPFVASAELVAAGDLQKVDLVTAEDFVEYASVNDEDIHELFFSVILYEGTESCLMCHQETGEAALEMGHFKWENKTDRMVGLEGGSHGKNDLLNNFCIAVPTNEGRCTQCHIGLGYADKTFDFEDPNNVDCLVCHDQSGTYKKGKTTAGMPDPSVDLNVVARSISEGAVPPRSNCIACHAFAGGGDNVKHGDISSDLLATTREYDVHMGTDGADFDCVACHAANHEPDTGEVNHGNAGMSLHSVNEGEMRQCTDCHGSQATVHARTDADPLFNKGWHEKLACQVCHIPAIARKVSTKTEWYWSDAGQDITPPIDPETGRPTYDKKKGTFVWKNNVRPVLRYSNGYWDRMVINETDKYSEEPIQLAVPQGGYDDPNAMIYPFKLMVGNQPVDPNTSTVLVPHLFGKKSGDNPYWGKFDWNLALQDGADYTGQDYSGTYGFGSTEMLLSVNHEIAPAENALGFGPMPDACMDCHSTEYIEWDKLGWTDDPLSGGEREGAQAAGPAISDISLK